MSYQAIHTDYNNNLPQIRKPARRSCYFDRRYHTEEGAWQLPYTAVGCQLSVCVQNCAKGYDNGTRKSNALVSLGLDQSLTLHDH